MTTVKEINHDSSTTIGDHYDTVTDPDGSLSVSAGAALNSSTYGVDCDLDQGTSTITLLEAFTALSGNDFRSRCRFDLSNCVNGGPGTTQFVIRLVYELGGGAGADLFEVRIDGETDGTYGTSLFNWSDGSASLESIDASSVVISGDSEVCIDLRCVRETADGNADGELEFFVNGSSKVNVSNLDNYNRWVVGGGLAQIHVSFGNTTADFSGHIYFDEWLLDDDSTTALCSYVFSGYNLVASSGGQL